MDVGRHNLRTFCGNYGRIRRKGRSTFIYAENKAYILRPPATRRIPNTKSEGQARRFPDPMANPYLAFAAMVMAGLDGIKNKIDPGPAMDKDLYDLP